MRRQQLKTAEIPRRGGKRGSSAGAARVGLRLDQVSQRTPHSQAWSFGCLTISCGLKGLCGLGLSGFGGALQAATQSLFVGCVPLPSVGLPATQENDPKFSLQMNLRNAAARSGAESGTADDGV